MVDVKNSKKETFFRITEQLGSYLCKRAFWSGSMCNWIGRTLEGATAYDDYFLPLINKALGPKIYDGTSGIALFLGQLYSYTMKDHYMKIARGAIRHALSRVQHIPRQLCFGFYTGTVGICYAAR